MVAECSHTTDFNKNGHYKISKNMDITQTWLPQLLLKQPKVFLIPLFRQSRIDDKDKERMRASLHGVRHCKKSSGILSRT